jgi:hypothetical protein
MSEADVLEARIKGIASTKAPNKETVLQALVNQ